MADPRLQSLSDLASAVPGLNQEALKRQKAANAIMFQRQLKQAPQGSAAALGQATTAANGQATLATQQATQQQVGQLGQQMLGVQGANLENTLETRANQQQADLAGANLAQYSQLASEENQLNKNIQTADIATASFVEKTRRAKENELLDISLHQAEELSGLDNQLKDELLNSRLQFDKDERGRKFSNERQLVDWTITNAKTEQEFTGMMDELEHQQQTKIRMLEFLYQSISDELGRQHVASEGQKNFEHQREMAQIRAELEKKIAKEKARAANRNSVIVSAFTVAGAVAGGTLAAAGTFGVGTGAGAVAGAAVGQGVGNMVAGSTA